ESYQEPEFRGLLLGGLRYAAGTVHADDRPEHGYVRVEAGDVAGWCGPEGYGRRSVKVGWRDGGAGATAYPGVPASADPVDAARSGGLAIQLDDPAGRLNPAGAWNTCEISIADGRAEVYQNGVRTAGAEGAVPAGRVWLAAGEGSEPGLEQGTI